MGNAGGANRDQIDVAAASTVEDSGSVAHYGFQWKESGKWEGERQADGGSGRLCSGC